MGEWEYTLGQAISHDECYFMPRYPRHVAQAFIGVSYDDILGDEDDLSILYPQRIELAIQDFALRWGGLGDTVFLRVLHEGRGRDRLVAIFAIGQNSACTHATDLLAPFLTSSDQLERCAAACMFALRRDERALPVLEEYLLHEPPKDEQGRALPESEVWYKSRRSRIARLLATWGPSSLVPILRQACLHLWKVEGQTVGSIYDQETQDALCYALGRRGALGAFHGIELPAQRRRIALMYLALGYVQADERFEDLHGKILLHEGLQHGLTMVLMEHFALSEEEGRATIRSYHKDIENRYRVASHLEDLKEIIRPSSQRSANQPSPLEDQSEEK